MEKKEILGFVVNILKGRILINAGNKDYSEIDKWIRENYKVLSFSCTKDTQPEFPNILSYRVA